MKRPSFQFYPGDWVGNQKLRRCSRPARSAWIDTLCALHDSDEYGLVRYPLRELADVVAAPLKLLQELADKLVLKGSDGHCLPFIYTPRHAGKAGQAVILVLENNGPCWYSSRMVTDEWVRHRRGSDTRFDSSHQPPKQAPKAIPKAIPKVGFGDPMGDGPSSSSSSSLKAVQEHMSDSAAPNSDAPPVEGKKHVNGYSSIAAELLLFLNEKTQHNFRPTPTTLKPIIARLKEGYSPSDCKAVIVRRWRKWKGDPKMEEYLRPSTLFGAEKFAQYVGEVPSEDDHAD